MTNKDNVLRIDLEGGTPVYRQIVEGLRTLLVRGAFAPGDKLPTVRQLAIELGVNHNTIAEAYRLLAGEGWLELKRHRGATVIKRDSPRAKAAAHSDFTQRLRALAARALADGLDAKSVTKHLRALSSELKLSKKTV